MRTRHVLILLALAAVPIGLAVLLNGSGGGPSRPAAGLPAADVSLELLGARAAGAVSGCGASHIVPTFAAGATIRFAGRVSSPGRCR